MKHILIPLIVVLAIVVQLGFAGAIVKEFKAEPGYNNVEIKWIVNSETNLKGYNVLRSMDRVNFQEITFVEAKGISGTETTYKYTDKSVFKSSDRTFYYKIQFVNTDESVSDYEEIIEVSPQISSARRTWGSIKAMFR